VAEAPTQEPEAPAAKKICIQSFSIDDNDLTFRDLRRPLEQAGYAPVYYSEGVDGMIVVITTLEFSTARTLEARFAETIRILDREFGRTPSPVPVDEPNAYTSTRLTQAGAEVMSIALGEVDGHPVVVAGCDDGLVKIWRLDGPNEPETVLTGHTGPVRAVALGQVDGNAAVVSGGEDRTVRLWDASTGVLVHVVNAHTKPVNSVVLLDGALVASGDDDGNLNLSVVGQHVDRNKIATHPGAVLDVAQVESGTVVTACEDGVARIWDLSDNNPKSTFTGHTNPVRAVAVGHSLVFSASDYGTVRGWNPETLEQVHRFSHPGPVRSMATGTIDGVPIVACASYHLITLWDLNSGYSTTLTGHTGSVNAVAIGTLYDKPVIVSGGDTTVRVWRPTTADQVEWLADKPSTEDLLRRRPLARAIAIRLERMDEQEPGTSFLAHIDGPWGAGKSTLVNFLAAELEPGFTTVYFDAWREKGVGPAWWALLTALRTAIREQRRWYGRFWLRITESLARLRRVGAPFVLALILIVGLGGGILWLFGLQDVTKAVTGSLAAVGTVWAGALVASRFLLWDSARGARLFEQSNSNPMLEVERHFAWLMAKSRKPVVFFIDDLDRCPDSYVVELLDTVQTLIRNTGPRAAHFMVAADGTWIRTSYELAHERFAEAVAAPGRPLGYLFLDKFFQLRIPVPAMDAVRQQHYLRELLKGPAPRQQVDEEEAKIREQLGRSVTEAQVVATFQAASPEVRDRVAGAALDKLTTPEAIAATEHSLQRFAGLLPANPRTMKRFVNAYSALRAVRTLEANAVRVESLALWTIIEIRWPSLADHLRARPESIELLGRPADELTAVPEALHPLFTDPALRLIVEFDRTTPFDADLIRLCSGN
jgi:hypothetical protein